MIRLTAMLRRNPALSAEEQQFNAAAFRVTGDPEANRLRPDGLRWIPKTNARIGVPVVSIHTLGDMYVSDPRYVATYDESFGLPGLARYCRDAIHANADRS